MAYLEEKLVKENASKVQNQVDYQTRHQALTEKYNTAKDELDKPNNALLQKKVRQKNLEVVSSRWKNQIRF